MARQSTLPSQRNLTLTEELEKLEQSITLTLQEIDHNFSRAHRIVTTSILPVVEQYSEHSRAIWEGSKFWKQFFEASANVSLSSYEEGAAGAPGGESETGDRKQGEGRDLGDDDGKGDEEEGEYEEETLTSAMTPSQSTYTGTPSRIEGQETPQPKASSKTAQQEDSFLSTPRNPPTQSTVPQIVGFSSPYESLKRELRGSPPDQDSELPSTPRNPSSNPIKSLDTTAQKSTRRKPPVQTPGTSNKPPNNDVVLHRILDKNYRLAATPLTTTRTTTRGPDSVPPRRNVPTDTPSASSAKRKSIAPIVTTTKKSHLFDDLDSSPAAPPAPTLNADLFESPAVRRRVVPGISVLASAKKQQQQQQQQQQRGTPRKDGLSAAESIRREEWDYDDDDDDEDEDSDADLLQGMSPPKTVQFHVPQSRLLQTPAREASKRIVEDLLLSAAGGAGGVDDDDDDDDDDNDGTGGFDTVTPERGGGRGGRGPGATTGGYVGDEDDSPSIVKPSREVLEDDTF